MIISIKECLLAISKELSAFETPQLDAEMIVGFALAMDRTALHMCAYDNVSDKDIAIIMGLVNRRKHHEPIAYLTGQKEFWRGSFVTNRKILVPRPDSESIIELVMELFPNTALPIRILDLGVGSGCLLVSLLQEYPHARGVGIDICNDAIITARENCCRNKVGSRATFFLQSWNKELALESFDIIVCNPPYIRSADLMKLNVRYKEPIRALWGGVNGLVKFTEVMRIGHKLLKKYGVLIFEIGADQQINSHIQGFREIAYKRDLSGIIRAVALCRITR